MIDIKNKIVTGKGSRIFCHSSSCEFILRSLSCLTKYRSALKKSFVVTSIPGSTEWLNLNSSIWGLKYLTYQSGRQRRQPTANLRSGSYPKLGPSKKSTWKAEALKTWGKKHAGSKAKERRAVTAPGSVTDRLQEAQNSPWRSLALPYRLPPGSSLKRDIFLNALYLREHLFPKFRKVEQLYCSTRWDRHCSSHSLKQMSSL